MLEVRYIKETNKVTGWRGDMSEFGTLDRGRKEEEIAVLDIPVPEKSCSAYMFDVKKGGLVPNPDYVKALPRDLISEVDELKARLTALEG